MNNRKFISIYFDAFAKRVENDILSDLFNGNFFDFTLSCKYDKYSTERLKKLHKDIVFLCIFYQDVRLWYR